MKKLLALVLALVMVLSLCTVTNAAYPDAADIDYEEAVDVMSAVGVFQGDEKGNFNPDANLTREQAAKLIAYLDLGEKVAEALPAVKVFSDVEANRWSAKYVAYCADAGIIAGVGDGKFDPTGELTGYAFGKMLLCVLGYDADIEGLTGASWAINVAKLMEKNAIADSVEGAASAALTREEAAQYCLNALKATTVDYDNKGTSIEINGATISSGASKAEEVKKVASNETIKEDDYVQLGEKLFPKLVLTTAHNDLGEPSAKWTNEKKEVGKYADEADYVITLDKAYTIANDAALLDLLQDKTDNDDLTYTGATKLYINGHPAATADLAAANKSGTVIEIYEEDNVATSVAVLVYQIAKVDKVDTKVSKADKEDDVTAYITLKTVGGDTIATMNKIKDTDFADFDYEKDDVVLYVAGDTNKILASELAESVEGEIVAKKSNKVSVDGTYYVNASGKTINNGDEGTYYLDKAGNIADLKAAETKSADYALIYSTDNESGKNADGLSGTTVYTVFVILDDGTKASYTLDADCVGTANTETALTAEKLNAIKPEAAYLTAYEINDDGEFVLKAASDKLAHTAKTALATGTKEGQTAKIYAGEFATKTSAFIFAEVDGSKMKVSNATGYANVSIAAGTEVYTVCDKNGYVLYAFVADSNGALESDTVYAVVLNATPEETKADSKTYYTYSVSVDGEDTTVTFKTTDQFDAKNVTAGNVVAYKMDGDYVLDGSVKVEGGIDNYKNEPKVSVANDEYVVLGDVQYDFADAEIYTITKDVDGTDVTITVAEADGFAKDDNVYYVVDGDELVIAWIWTVIE